MTDLAEGETGDSALECQLQCGNKRVTARMYGSASFQRVNNHRMIDAERLKTPPISACIIVVVNTEQERRAARDVSDPRARSIS